MDVVVVDEGFRNRDEGDVTSEATVVEPVDANGRNAVDHAGGVDRDDYEVGARMQHGGGFTVEWRKAALVIADAFLIDPYMGTVVGRADVEEGACAGGGLEVEVALIPDHTFVVEELGHLGIPVAGHFECGCAGKVVLLIVLAHDVGTFVHAVTLIVDLTIVGIKSAAWGLIDEVVPVSIEGADRSVVYAHQKRVQLRLSKCFDPAKKTKK